MGNEGSQHANLGQCLDNDVKVKWSKICDDSLFPGRDGHCACAVGNQLFVFGGVVSTDAEDSTESNELLLFDADELKWTQVVASGSVPDARSAATLTAVGNKLYLMGGLSRNSGWFDDVHTFDTETKTWTKAEIQGQGPSPRDKLASTVIGSKIYLFGGFGPKLQEDVEEVEEFSSDEETEEELDSQEAAQFGWFNDLFILDTGSMSWSQPMQMNIGGPTPRAAHAMASIKDQYVVIFGGRDSEARRNDVHIFDTVTRKWLVDVKVSGHAPEPRSFHTMTAVKNRVVVFGGRGTQDQHFNDFHIFDVDTHEWLQPSVDGDVPPPRGVHTATVVTDKLVIYGGSSNFNRNTMQCTQLHNAVYSINTDEILAGSCKVLTGSSEKSTEGSSSSGDTLLSKRAINAPSDESEAKRQKLDPDNSPGNDSQK